MQIIKQPAFAKHAEMQCDDRAIYMHRAICRAYEICSYGRQTATIRLPNGIGLTSGKEEL